MNSQTLQIIKILKNIVFAIVFGAMFWWFLEFIQTITVNYKFSCCERCGNILFDREQPILAFCAALSCLILAFLKINGWRGILKTLAVTFACFYIYWLFTYISGHPRQECNALNYPRGALPFFNELAMYIVSGIWASICSVALIIYQGIRIIFSSKMTDEEIL